MKEIFIIAGGNSIDSIDRTKLEGKNVMVINKAVIDFPEAKYFVTMDYSFLNKVDKIQRVLDKFKGTKIFVANLEPNYMEEINGVVTDTRWTIKYNLKAFDMIIKSRKSEGIAFNWNDFRSGINSGFCAFQLAILMGYEKINLVGFDFIAEGKTHYHGGYGLSVSEFNERLDLYYKHIRCIILDLLKEEQPFKIYNCSKISRLKDILPYKELS